MGTMRELMTDPLAACIRKPTLLEAPSIHALIEVAASNGEVLPRRVEEVAEGIRDFHIYADETGIVGCCAAHVDTAKLAEIRSLVVHPDARSRGVGHALVKACIEEAREIGIPYVYALTRKVPFFEKLGFCVTTMDRLPQKVFKDCERCPRYHACDETAVMLDLAPVVAPAGPGGGLSE
jgi:amino-acid N-acetyltransferase